MYTCVLEKNVYFFLYIAKWYITLKKYTFFSSTHGPLSRIDPILGHENQNRNTDIKIISRASSNPNKWYEIKIEQ